MTLAVNRAMTSDRLSKEEPVTFWVMQDDIGHLPVRFHGHAKPGQQWRIEITPFLTSVA